MPVSAVPIERADGSWLEFAADVQQARLQL
jgi:hypothetical protein